MKTLSLKYLAVIFLTAEISFSQDIPATVYNVKIQNNSNTDILRENVTEDSKISASRIEKKIEKERIENLEFRFYKAVKPEKYSFDLISSLGSNVSFGGIWEKYAVVNFTPQMFIRPLGFISIYANHNVNYLVPLRGIKEYSQTIALQGLAVLAVDNSMKFLLNNKISWIADVASFAVKNILINLLIKPVISQSTKSETPILQYDNYYYSMSIIF